MTKEKKEVPESNSVPKEFKKLVEKIEKMSVLELAELVKLDNNFFTLGSGEEVRMSFELTIPASAEIREYSGKVFFQHWHRILRIRHHIFCCFKIADSIAERRLIRIVCFFPLVSCPNMRMKIENFIR